jgi:hypothetical protein
MDYESQMDAENDYLEDNYFDMITLSDIIDWLDGISNIEEIDLIIEHLEGIRRRLI